MIEVRFLFMNTKKKKFVEKQQNGGISSLQVFSFLMSERCSDDLSFAGFKLCVWCVCVCVGADGLEA